MESAIGEGPAARSREATSTDGGGQRLLLPPVALSLPRRKKGEVSFQLPGGDMIGRLFFIRAGLNRFVRL